MEEESGAGTSTESGHIGSRLLHLGSLSRLLTWPIILSYDVLRFLSGLPDSRILHRNTEPPHGRLREGLHGALQTQDEDGVV